MRIKANDNANLAGVDLTTTGQGADFMIQLAASSVAPAFERAWRSGVCIAVLVDPEGGDVDKDSETTVTAKVKHKIDGNELDKPVEATLYEGVKSIEPAGKKQKAPATFRYTAGSEDDDRGYVTFESVSNRGIGKLNGVIFTVAGSWTISSTGSSNEAFQSVVANRLRVTIKDLRVTADKDHAVTGSGTITLTGPVTSGAPPVLCTGQLDQTIRFTVKGTVDRSAPDAVLRLTLLTASPSDAGDVMMTCFPGFPAVPVPAEGFSDRYGETLGQFDLPAGGGTKTISRSAAMGGVMNVDATGTFTVVRGKP